ncbi:MAG: glycoside hydrolase family 2 protein, partial [Limisphaerales bacterium]
MKIREIRVKKLLCISWLIPFLFSFCVSAQTIDISGKWQFQLDPQDAGIKSNFFEKEFSATIHLPGTISEARKGNQISLEPTLPVLPPENLNPKKGLTFGRDPSALTNSPLAHLQQRFFYIGPAWYRREVEIPKNWTNKDVELVLERVIWESRVWVNGQFIGARNSLTTPHRYEIGGALKPGRNQIVIRVDNRRQLEIGNPHAYTEESQTIWNGIIGQIALVARDKIRLDGLQLRPDLARKGVEVTAFTHNGGEKEIARELFLQAAPENFHGKKLPEMKVPISLSPGDGEQNFFYPMGTNFELWSEFNPKLYRMRATLAGENIHSEIADTLGMREFKATGRHFFINGQPTFLRGTVNCCEFPKTGYPDMTGEQWKKIFSTAKAFGLNHMRFHTWCPPEIAFEMADRYGIYLEVELPDWSFQIGADTNVTEFFRAEGERMIREYGNHPSWVMLTMGNELKGDYSVLDDLENHFRKLDPQLLYDSTTYP